MQATLSLQSNLNHLKGHIGIAAVEKEVEKVKGVGPLATIIGDILVGVPVRANTKERKGEKKRDARRGSSLGTSIIAKVRSDHGILIRKGGNGAVVSRRTGTRTARNGQTAARPTNISPNTRVAEKHLILLS